MRIAVIGAGNIGGTLGRTWAEAGHDVTYGVRSPGAPGTTTVPDAVSGAEVVVLAVPGPAAKAVLASLGTALAGKVVIDATNDMQGGAKQHALDELADGAHPVRAFNTLGWENFADPTFDGDRSDMFWCGPEGRATEVAEQVIRDVGLRPVRIGGPEQVDVVDGVLRLWFALMTANGGNRRLGFKALGL
jgi:8-hydroxy-5-deazaflavin:NADPH oxidoreductase